MRISPRRTPTFLFLAAMALPAIAQEAPPSLPASALAPAPMVKSPLHKVAEPIRIEGYLGKFDIESSVGKFSVRGVNMLGVRVQELAAIAELQKVQKDQAFQGALAKSVGGIAKFAGDTVADPNKTVENIGAGAGKVFGRMTYMAQSGAAYVGDKAVDKVTGATPEKAATDETAPSSFTGDPLGYNAARREWAKKLNVDPYTTNPVLRPLLDKAASATFAGNFAVSLTLGAVVGPLQYAYTFDETVRDSVWNKPAVDLQKENEAKLAALGVQGRAVRDLLRNPWFTPSLQTALVARLGTLGKMPGMEGVVAAAAKVQGETRTRFLLESLGMLAVHHTKGGKLASLRMSNLVPLGVGADGSVVAAAAVDYVTWDAEAVAFASRKELGTKGKTLLVAGKVSDRAAKELKKAGWSVKDGLRA